MNMPSRLKNIFSQRCGGMKRKQGDSSQCEESASPSLAIDISNTSMSTCSKEERVKAIKREEQSASWISNPAVDISNSSMSSSFTSKEDSVEDFFVDDELSHTFPRTVSYQVTGL